MNFDEVKRGKTTSGVSLSLREAAFVFLRGVKDVAPYRLVRILGFVPRLIPMCHPERRARKASEGPFCKAKFPLKAKAYPPLHIESGCAA